MQYLIRKGAPSELFRETTSIPSRCNFFYAGVPMMFIQTPTQLKRTKHDWRCTQYVYHSQVSDYEGILIVFETVVNINGFQLARGFVTDESSVMESEDGLIWTGINTRFLARIR